MINSKVVDGKNKYKEFVDKYFVSSFGNPPSKGIQPAITPVLISEMNEDGTATINMQNGTSMTVTPDSEGIASVRVASMGVSFALR